ncbi:MAG: ATP-grasp fold amidoligase family protein [Octadecabacter sp.]
MRPFYEQQHFNNRPFNDAESSYIVEYVNDFMKWNQDNVAETTNVKDACDTMTAVSMMHRRQFRQSVYRGVKGYCKRNGEWPDFFKPRSFAGMNILHAITMALPREQPADKLKVGTFIPDSLSNQLQSAEIVGEWDSGDAVNFDDIAPGVYFFKANHGSAFNVKVNVPCTDDELAHIRSEANKWLATAYGENSCQWWYQFIDRKVFLEKELSENEGDGPLRDFRFHIINGKAALLQLDVGVGTDDHHNPVYDENLNYMPHNFLRKNLKEEPLPEMAERAQAAAIQIGSRFQYCRVDLYVQKKKIILGELTFLPNAGRRPVKSPELDEYLCSFWDGNMPKATRIHEARHPS